MTEERGLTVVNEGEMPAECDAALVQDAGVSLQLADRYPDAPQLFVAHSEIFDLQVPPQLDGVVGLIVALNERVASRMRALSSGVEVVRLRQPIDTERFTPRGALPDVPRSALLLSNTPHDDRLAMIEVACDAAGIELTRLGGSAGQKLDPRQALAEADVVIGYGRSILEAMACGRAAYVYDWKGGDGWVTPESYPAIEADGIGGRTGKAFLDAEGLAGDLAGYRASMGPVNHDIVLAHHRANVHVQELVELIRTLAKPASRPRDGLDEMARLVRLEWRAQAEIRRLTEESVGLRQSIENERAFAQELLQENARLYELVAKADRDIEQAKAEAEAERRQAEAVARAFESTTSWRLTRPFREMAARLKGGGGGG